MERRRHFTQHRNKFTEAVIHLCTRSIDDPDFGETKLVKLLYYADSAAYQADAEPLTGTTYLHFPNGPFPANWYTIKDELVKTGELEIRLEPIATGIERKRPVAIRPVRAGVLSAEDVAALDQQIERFAGYNANDMVAFSHRELGWRITGDRDPIPYELSRFSAPERDDELIQEARRIAAEDARRRANLHGH
jgi:uncharacterized phage-associated protein